VILVRLALTNRDSVLTRIRHPPRLVANGIADKAHAASRSLDDLRFGGAALVDVEAVALCARRDEPNHVLHPP